MLEIILKLTALFTIILIPLIPRRGRSMMQRPNRASKIAQELSNYSINSEGYLVREREAASIIINK